MNNNPNNMNNSPAGRHPADQQSMTVGNHSVGITTAADLQATLAAFANQQQQAAAAAAVAQGLSAENAHAAMQYLEGLGNAQVAANVSNIGTLLQLLNPSLLSNSSALVKPSNIFIPNLSTSGANSSHPSLQTTHSGTIGAGTKKKSGNNQYTPQHGVTLLTVESLRNLEHLPPQGFEFPTVQHRLDPRWQLCWYKSIDHFQNRRRYTAKCICCGYELEGRPERMSKHILYGCINVTAELKDEYKKVLERTGKFSFPGSSSGAVTSKAVSKGGSSGKTDNDDGEEGNHLKDSNSDIEALNDLDNEINSLSPSKNNNNSNSINQIQTSLGGSGKKRKRGDSNVTQNQQQSGGNNIGNNSRISNSEGNLLSSLLNENITTSSLPAASKHSIGGRRTMLASNYEELLVFLFFEGSLSSLSLLDIAEGPSTYNSAIYNSQAAALHDLCCNLPDFSSINLQQLNYAKLLFKVLPELERKYLMNFPSFLTQESKCWTVFVASQVLLNGMNQFFIILKHAEYEICVGMFKLALDNHSAAVNVHHHALIIETIYSNIWSRVEALSIPRHLLTYSMPCEITLTTVSAAATALIPSLTASNTNALPPSQSQLPNSVGNSSVLSHSTSTTTTAGQASSMYASNPTAGSLLLQNMNANVAPIQQQQLQPLSSLTTANQQTQQHYHFIRIDLKDTDNRLISIPCLLTALQALLRYFATIVKPLSIVQEMYRYLLYHPLWLSTIHHFLLSRNQSYLPIPRDAGSPYANYFSLYYHFEVINIYLFTMREILSLDQFNKSLPPLTAELLEMVNNPNYLITISAYCKVLKPVVEGIEQLIQEKSSITLAHCIKILLMMESSLLRMNLINEGYMNDLRTAVLNKLHEITVSYDVDLFIVSLFLWPRYKNLAMSKKYDYNAIRQGILRLANVLKCFAIDQAYQLVHEIEMYRTNASPFSFTEEQLDLNSRELWDLFPDKNNVLCIIARKLFAITAISITGREFIQRYNQLLGEHNYDENLAEKLFFLSTFHQSQVLEKQKNSWISQSLSSSMSSSAAKNLNGNPNNLMPSKLPSPMHHRGPLNQSHQHSQQLHHHYLQPQLLSSQQQQQQQHHHPAVQHGSVHQHGGHYPSTSYGAGYSNPVMTAHVPQRTSLRPLTALQTQASRSIEDVSFTWIEAEIRCIQLIHEKENQDMSNNYRSRRPTLEEVFDFSVFLQIEAIVKARQESAALTRERESAMLKSQQYDWDPASILADYERKNI